MRYLSMLVFGLLIALNTSAQNGTVSPYSFIGLGEVAQSKSVEEIQMGGIGVAYSDGTHVGMSNPATYSYMSLTGFSVGAASKNYYIGQNGEEANGSVTSVSYLNFSVPLGRRGGMVVGLMPASNVGYSLVSFEEDEEGEPFESDLYRGSGATNRIFYGLGYEVFKGLSLGAEIEYVFGNIEHSILNQRKDVQYGTKFYTDSNVYGLRGKFGLLYQADFEKHYISFGAQLSLAADARFYGDQYFYPVNLNQSEDLPKGDDTPTSVDGNIEYPMSTGLGFGYGKRNQWYVEADYNFKGAPVQSGAAFQNGGKFKYENYNKYSLGAYFIPKYNSISSYWARSTYRIGFKYEQTGLLIDGDANGALSEVQDLGMAFGVGLPLRSPGSKINIGIDFGRRGNSNGDLLKENYLNIRMSVALLDKWFIKRQYN